MKKTALVLLEWVSEIGLLVLAVANGMALNKPDGPGLLSGTGVLYVGLPVAGSVLVGVAVAVYKAIAGRPSLTKPASTDDTMNATLAALGHHADVSFQAGDTEQVRRLADAADKIQSKPAPK